MNMGNVRTLPDAGIHVTHRAREAHRRVSEDIPDKIEPARHHRSDRGYSRLRPVNEADTRWLTKRLGKYAGHIFTFPDSRDGLKTHITTVDDREECNRRPSSFRNAFVVTAVTLFVAIAFRAPVLAGNGFCCRMPGSVSPCVDAYTELLHPDPCSPGYICSQSHAFCARFPSYCERPTANTGSQWAGYHL